MCLLDGAAKFIMAILRPVARFIPRLTKRLSWELEQKKKQNHLVDKPFHATFEISSEGEWQQVAPLVELLLSHGLRVQVIAASESLSELPAKLEKKWERYIGQWAWLKLPLLSYGHPMQVNLKKWVNSPYFFFCRYDLYPHLIALKKSFPQMKFILLNATFKGRTKFWWFWPRKRWDLDRYSFFNHLVLASAKDQQTALTLFKNNGPKLSLAEFRSQLILQRVFQAAENLKLNAIGGPIKTWRENKKDKKCLILGNIWPEDLDLLKSPAAIEHFSDGGLVLIVPHLVDGEVGEFFRSYNWDESFGKSWMVVDQALSARQLEENQSRLQVVIVLAKGILVELYTLSEVAFIGGGHGRSVHSVLEPYLASAFVLCGHRIHRSTEWDQIQGWAPSRSKMLNRLSDLRLSFSEMVRVAPSPLAINEIEHSKVILHNILDEVILTSKVKVGGQWP